jgi:hypothetical protein
MRKLCYLTCRLTSEPTNNPDPVTPDPYTSSVLREFKDPRLLADSDPNDPSDDPDDIDSVLSERLKKKE